MKITAAEMKPGVLCIVTNASHDGEYQVGDRIRLEADGSMSNLRVQGWMDSEDIPDGAAGMLCEVDAAVRARRVEQLKAELERLQS